MVANVLVIVLIFVITIKGFDVPFVKIEFWLTFFFFFFGILNNWIMVCYVWFDFGLWMVITKVIRDIKRKVTNATIGIIIYILVSLII